jgi:DNA repair exonuclease SbcCD ATPase subunit
MDILSIQHRISELTSQRTAAIQSVRQEKDRLASLKQVQIDTEEARGLVQAVAQTVQQRVHNQIAGVVTECLRSVFGEDYQFEIRFEQKRGRTEANIMLIKDGHEIGNPLEEDSGGVVNVAAFALRLSCLILTKPRLRRVLVLDEPFKDVSAQYRPAVKAMLEGLAEKLAVQFLIVTHISELQCGKVVRL